MFVEAIEKAAKYTRPIHTITKPYRGETIIPGAATLFFVNDKGYAITCKHVVEMLIQSKNVTKNYAAFKTERDGLPRDGKFVHKLNRLKIKYKIGDRTIVHQKNNFVNCVDKMSGFTSHIHPDYDLAIIKFNDFSKLHCKAFAVFKKDTDEIKQGMFLCRLGFPFPEFTNFRFNEKRDDIEWTRDRVRDSPRFPMEGMVTRFLGDGKGIKYGIELSTPGLRGQSGGPLFDANGIVCGMQSKTNHLHLGFDIENKEIITKGQPKKVNDYSFIHLGHCISAGIIKDFLRQNKVEFDEI